MMTKAQWKALGLSLHNPAQLEAFNAGQLSNFRVVKLIDYYIIHFDLEYHGRTHTSELDTEKSFLKREDAEMICMKPILVNP